MNEAEAVPPPAPQEMFRSMYATMPPALREQEAALLAWLQQKG
jgi:TPP-dependent pyruvate/acetoin dehydrogenase alpha subunit